jgi:hypothetical protein
MPELTAISLVPHLKRCGYVDTLRAQDYDFGSGSVEVATFSDTPHDSRSICTVAVNTTGDPAETVRDLRASGAPVVF